MKKRLLLMIVLIGAIAAIVKAKAGHESGWHGLSESEARAKLDAKLPSKIPADKRAEISDKVVTKMRDRGVLADDAPADETTDADAATDAAEQLTSH